MKNIKFVVPNALTIINLLCGTLAIVNIFEGHPLLSVYLLMVAAVADVLDGLFAKILKATSEFGKQLDSLSDLVSFGVAPAVFMYTMAKASAQSGESELVGILIYTTFFIAVFAALRLARFNIDTSKSIDFRGLPVPANALFVISVWLVFQHVAPGSFIIKFYTPAFFIALTLLLSYLMISNIRMLSFKLHNFRLKENFFRYLLVVGAVLIFGFGGISSLIYIMVYYIVLSLTKHFSKMLSTGNKIEGRK
jgi:CDP-diacylglycerol---serine O-phosphatidyltransferase